MTDWQLAIHPLVMIPTLLFGLLLALIELKSFFSSPSQARPSTAWAAPILFLLILGSGVAGKGATWNREKSLKKMFDDTSTLTVETDHNRAGSPFPSEDIAEAPRPPITGQEAELRADLKSHLIGAIGLTALSFCTLILGFIARSRSARPLRAAYLLCLCGVALVLMPLLTIEGITLSRKLDLLKVIGF